MLALKPLVDGSLLGWGPYQWLDGLHNQVHGPPHGLVAIGLAIVVGLGGLATSGSNKLHVGTKCLAWQLGLVGPNYKLQVLPPLVQCAQGLQPPLFVQCAQGWQWCQDSTSS